MPKYFYRCKGCDHEFEIYHSIHDLLQNCDKCEVQETLIRVPSLVHNISIKQGPKTKKAVGSIVNKFIKDTKEEIKQEKEKLSKEKYKP